MSDHGQLHIKTSCYHRIGGHTKAFNRWVYDTNEQTNFNSISSVVPINFKLQIEGDLASKAATGKWGQPEGGIEISHFVIIFWVKNQSQSKRIVAQLDHRSFWWISRNPPRKQIVKGIEIVSIIRIEKYIRPKDKSKEINFSRKIRRVPRWMWGREEEELKLIFQY